jgi:hypothetical protein
MVEAFGSVAWRVIVRASPGYLSAADLLALAEDSAAGVANPL